MSRPSPHSRLRPLPLQQAADEIRSDEGDNSRVPPFTRRPAEIYTPPHSGIPYRFEPPSYRKRHWQKPLLLILVVCAVAFALSRLEFRKAAPSIGDVVPASSARDLSLDEKVPLPRTHPLGEISHEVQRGETLSQIMNRYGFDSTTIEKIKEPLQADEGLRNKLSNLKPADRLDFVSDGSVFPLRIELPTTDRQRVFLERVENDVYMLKLIKLRSTARERVAVGIVTSSFAGAAAKASIPYDVVDELVDVFGDRVAFEKDFQEGDRFTIIYRDVTDSKGDSSDASVLAASIRVKGKNLVVARYIGTDGKPRYFDGDGKILGETFLRYPLKFSRISSQFTFARFHPVLKKTRPHNGVDFAAPVGTPVRSISRGKVEFAGPNGGSGIMIKIQHGDRYSTAYLHLSRITPGIRRGTMVERGEVIGAVGQTGLATGPHLHFSLFDRGKYVDPLKVDLPVEDTLDRGTMIPKAYLARLVFTLQHYQSLDLSDMNWSE